MNVSAGERMAEASAAYVGDRFFPSTLATVVPTPADFVNFPNWCSCLTPPRARSTFLSYCKLITPGLVGVVHRELPRRRSSGGAGAPKIWRSAPNSNSIRMISTNTSTW